VDAYVEAHCSLLVRYKATQPLCDPRARGVLARLLKCTGVRRLLLGQSLYVSYVRV